VKLICCSFLPKGGIGKHEVKSAVQASATKEVRWDMVHRHSISPILLQETYFIEAEAAALLALSRCPWNISCFRKNLVCCFVEWLWFGVVIEGLGSKEKNRQIRNPGSAMRFPGLWLRAFHHRAG